MDLNIEKLKFIRATNYNGIAWILTAGMANNQINNYIDMSNPSLHYYVTGLKSENGYDTKHFAATLNAMVYDTSFLKLVLKQDVKNKTSLDDLSGWAADLQSLTSGKTIQENQNENKEFYKEKLKDKIFSKETISSFDYYDFIADIDARNIAYYYNLNEIYLSEVLNQYNKYTEKEKKEMFIKSYGSGDYEKGVSKLRVLSYYYMFNTSDKFTSYFLNDVSTDAKEALIELFIEELLK